MSFPLVAAKRVLIFRKHAVVIMSTTTTTRKDLLKAAECFCEAFASKRPLEDVLGFFTTTGEPVAVEHGLKQLAPFLGKTFSGHDGVKDYFSIISDLLSYEDMQFSDYIVDTETMKVSVRGRASFTWKSTSKSWPEIFTYSLEFDRDLKIKTYEVWADSGAAYLASRGELCMFFFFLSLYKTEKKKNQIQNQLCRYHII